MPDDQGSPDGLATRFSEAMPEMLFALAFVVAWITPRLFSGDVVWALGTTMWAEIILAIMFLCSFRLRFSSFFSVFFGYSFLGFVAAFMAFAVARSAPSWIAGLATLIAMLSLARTRIAVYMARPSVGKRLLTRYCQNIAMALALVPLVLVIPKLPWPSLGLTPEFLSTMVGTAHSSRTHTLGWMGDFDRPQACFALGVLYFTLSALLKFYWQPQWADSSVFEYFLAQDDEQGND
jgi:hypothetical protein